ncbi:hypothetical protein BGZ72_004392 [Mortierella alpina]|nr:hypothetical protein BGZ72_004392 [Mortierella alpina]
MSLYGDLPPPSTAAAEGPSKKAEGDAKEGTAASGAAKSVLPAGWSSSITRLKPMLNRKLAPPKARPAQRTIPAGFVAQSVQEPHKEAAAAIHPPTGASSSTAGNNVAAPSTGAQHSSGNTLDENSWLKARTAQVQRNDNDVHSLGRKQMKRTPVKAQQQQGPIGLDDEYDISRPNEYDDFKALFEEDWKSRAEERRKLQGQARSGRGEFRHSGSPSRSRSRSRSWSQSQSRSRSPSRSRSGSRQKSWSPESRTRSRRKHSRSLSPSPPPR